jgi:hypothetical protein
MVLALDLGTTTGFAFRSAGGVIGSGTWDLHPHGECEAIRFERLADTLTAISPSAGIGAVYYEDVRRHVGNLAARVYNGLLATLQVWCHERGIPCVPVGVGQIKKFWTNNGRASKDEMIAEAHHRGFNPSDDNEADALALLHYAIIKGDEGAPALCVEIGTKKRSPRGKAKKKLK